MLKNGLGNKMRILLSPIPYTLIGIAFLLHFILVIPLAYLTIGIITANIAKYFRLRKWKKKMLAYKANKALANPDKSIGKPDRPSGGEYFLEYIVLTLFWVPILIMTSVSHVNKYLNALKGKTEWNYSNGTWDYQGWEDTPTNRNKNFNA